MAFAAVAASVCAGLLLFYLHAAPTSYLIVNGLALALAFALIVAGNPIRSSFIAPAVAIAAILLMIAAVSLGREVEGVRRWIMLGPVSLHAGFLTIPALVAVLPHQRQAIAPIAVVIVSVIIWLMPDFATALALFAGVSAASIRIEARLLALAGLLLTALQPDRLAPVPLVETAIQDGWSLSPALGMVLALSLAVAVFIPANLIARGVPDLRSSKRAVIAAFAAFAVVPLFGAFPQPLIGYGASAIIGYGFALAVLRLSR